MATERAGYVLYRALVIHCINPSMNGYNFPVSIVEEATQSSPFTISIYAVSVRLIPLMIDGTINSYHNLPWLMMRLNLLSTRLRPGSIIEHWFYLPHIACIHARDIAQYIVICSHVIMLLKSW